MFDQTDSGEARRHCTNFEDTLPVLKENHCKNHQRSMICNAVDLLSSDYEFCLPRPLYNLIYFYRQKVNAE